MINGHRLPFTASGSKGYRLHKLEVLNWGTFDGKVFTVRPNGSSALLIGQNGSGKSTLVDAILTLLVRPGIRNFNVAAGGKKRERDERSYLLGAFDRGGNEDGSGVKEKQLRPKGDHISVILGYFRNEDTEKSFTAAQLMFLASDQTVDKVYCLSDGERSIQADFQGIDSTDKLLKVLRDRNFRVSKTFQDFEGWFGRQAKLKPKAMEVFNQTVAVKDIQRLNDFIRDHMLERHDWDSKVERLLGHFSQLSEAHDSLVRVRQQLDLLDPVSRIAEEFRKQSEALNLAEAQLAALPAFVSQKIVDLFAPALEACRATLAQTRSKMNGTSEEIRSYQEQDRSIRNEIDREGGDRLRMIPELIKTEAAHVQGKRRLRERCETALAQLGIPNQVTDEAMFISAQGRLPHILKDVQGKVSHGTAAQEKAVLERGEVRRTLSSLRQELESLGQRRENVPTWCVELRRSLCAELGITERDLPFAAELIEVRREEKVWEASIEKVLRGFALSLLVPERYYQLVARHVDGTRLTVDGRGQRLTYLRVGEQIATNSRHRTSSQSLVQKLNFRDSHALVPWVKGEIADRFDYDCCDTIEEFQSCRGLALTQNRHVKSGNARHEKDDRDEAIDPRRFVLGWDNREKKRRIADEISRLQGSEGALSSVIDAASSELGKLQDQIRAVAEAQRVISFDEIDDGKHQREIESLEAERRAIEQKSGKLQLLRARLSEVESKLGALEDRVRQLAGDERELETRISDGQRVMSNAEADLRKREREETLAGHRTQFAALEAAFNGPTLTPESISSREKEYRNQQDLLINQLRDQIKPTYEDLLSAMAGFLQKCPEEAKNLRPSVKYLDGFLGLRQRIVDDDLPKHERRFKERLNQKVIEEIGLFRNALEQERRSISEKIELLNLSLKKLEYRPGTHIQLEPRPIRDPEITEFQGKLRECVEGSFEDSSEANEARFVKIKSLVLQLSDEATRRWRDKVIDVRRWFDFVATVVDRESLKPISVYQDSSGQSGGEKAKLAFTILVAAIAYQYDLDPDHPVSDRFHFVVVDEMFSKVDDQHAEYALDLFKQFGLQLLIVAPLDAKARVTQPYVGSYMHVVKKDNRSAIYEMSATEFDESLGAADPQILNVSDDP